MVVGFLLVHGAIMGGPAVAQDADLVLRGGKVVTMDAQRPGAEAVAVSGDRIVAVGSDAEIAKRTGRETRIVELAGRLVVPGLIESHGHLLDLGQLKLQLDFLGTTSEAQIAGMVATKARAARPGEWIRGRRWDQNDWGADTRFPTADSISRAALRNPVYLTRIDGHAAWVNRLALQSAGITKETPDPPGGRILRDDDGNPTGVLIDRAMGLVGRIVPDWRHDDNKRAVRLAIAECVEAGLTSFHDAGSGVEEIGIYKELLAEGELGLRIYVMLWGANRSLLDDWFRRGPEIGLGDGRLTIRAIKLMADGALGSRGAALFDPYDDDPGQKGLLILSEDDVYGIADRALAHGFQLCTHAIGDRANRIVLDAYERAFAAHRSVKDPRFRIEHAQILDEEDIPRFAQLGVIASMQATHATSDMPWVPARVGAERAKEGAYVWRKLLRTGARIANGSDAPVEQVAPLLGFHAAITRQDASGNPSGGWYPAQRMTREQALRSFTLDAAYAAFEEAEKGSIEPGKLADLVVLSRDIMTIPPPEILRTQVDMTIIGGRIEHEREERVGN